VALPREKTRLVARGIYGWIRNPCVVGADLLALGTLLIAPSLVALLALALNVVGYHLKIRFEEEYLQQVFGAEYETYRMRTGRYFPRLTRRSR
jgi:protein-S-isoprenylcysteine O-methyltransferase Ste14